MTDHNTWIGEKAHKVGYTIISRLFRAACYMFPRHHGCTAAESCNERATMVTIREISLQLGDRPRIVVDLFMISVNYDDDDRMEGE